MALDATPEEVRAAYRRRARELHPDIAGAEAEAAMRAVNDAYRVLSDPARRVVYDRQLRGGPDLRDPVAGPQPSEAVVVPEPVRPARFPWRGFAVATTVAVIAVAGASVLSKPATPAPPDGILQPGSCVRIEPNTDAREVACTGTGDLVVRQVVPIGAGCPYGTRGHRDHQGQGTACVESSATN